MKLTDQGVRALPFPVRSQREYHDDAVTGLCVRVGKRSKTFMLVTGTGASRRRHTLGPYDPPHFTLAVARERAKDIIAQTRLEKSEAPRITFDEAFKTYDRVHVGKLRAGSQRAIRQTFARRFLPQLGKKQLADIKPIDVAPLIDAMLSTPTEMHNAFVYLGMFFNWCMRRGYIETVPTARMEKPKKPPSRERTLSTDELTAIWRAALDDDYGRIIKLCILTGQRIGQWAGMRREYINGDTIVWPSGAMKANRAHTLPLTTGMRELLPDRLGLLFPTHNVRAFSNWTRSKDRLDRESGISNYTHHDLRRTFATISAEEPLNIDPHIIESILAHAIGTRIARTYNRARYSEPMRKALLAFEEWLHIQLSKPEDNHERRQLF